MTSQSPRDRGKIAQAFPQLGISAEGRAENRRRREYAVNNPESQAAMELAASGGVFGGKNSGRSPSRVSAATRRQLTGVTERPDRQAWIEAHALPHLCFPPDQYPSGAGPGSRWNCRCDAVWRADGVLWDEYPTDPSRTAQPLKPERWFYVEGGQLEAADYQAQEGLYDWRPLGPYYVKLYRAMIDNQHAYNRYSSQLGKDVPVKWEDLG